MIAAAKAGASLIEHLDRGGERDGLLRVRLRTTAGRTGAKSLEHRGMALLQREQRGANTAVDLALWVVERRLTMCAADGMLCGVDGLCGLWGHGRLHGVWQPAGD